MTDNNGNERTPRNSNRPEDNPFIAFRRYADSQVSSLLNTVFTLPAQIANYNNAYHAREQCLFGKADPQKCEELQALDAHTEKLRHEGTESYRAGDVQAVLKKSEELMVIEHQAAELRRAILSEVEESRRSTDEQKQLVEKVGNRKGQEWSDSWDWPVATRDEEQHEPEFVRWLESHVRRAGGGLERMFARLEDDASKSFGEEMEELRRHWAARHGDTRRDEDAHSRGWCRAWSWQWPPPADSSQQHGRQASQDLYSPSALEADERTKHMGTFWRSAFEDLMRTTQEHPLLSDTQNTQLDQMGLYALRDYVKHLSELEQDHEKKMPTARQTPTHIDASDEPSYEYAHDHEDQHDDPPTPKPKQTEFPESHFPSSGPAQSTETELDAYERLLTPSSSSPLHAASQSKILSTLTTTERSTALDGTVTTKVVLKKRFADGSEQSSETIHIQRGDHVHQTEEPWKAMRQSSEARGGKDKKKGGWFWSN